MDKSEKIQFLNSIKEGLLNLAELDLGYKVFITKLEIFISKELSVESSTKWKKELSGIHWTSRVYSSDPRNDRPQREAWSSARNQVMVIIECIENELSLEQLYQDNYSSAILSIVAPNLEELSAQLFTVCPELVDVVKSIGINLKSTNSEDWANAVNSSRRILMKLADVLFPPTKEVRVRNNVKHELTKDHYVNRLIAFVEDQPIHNTSRKLLLTSFERFLKEIDAVNSADSKGTHDNVTLPEAKMYVLYSFMFAGNLVTLKSLSK